VTGRFGRRKQLLDGLEKKKRTLEIGRGSTRLHCAQNSLWNRLRTCRKTDNRRRRPSSSCATMVALVANCPARMFGPNIFFSVPSHFLYSADITPCSDVHVSTIQYTATFVEFHVVYWKCHVLM